MKGAGHEEGLAPGLELSVVHVSASSRSSIRSRLQQRDHAAYAPPMTSVAWSERGSSVVDNFLSRLVPCGP